MTDTHAEFNPFQPPVSSTLPLRQTLGDDDKYLILKKYIHCRGDVELPKICIFYGEADDVEPRRHTLRTMKLIALAPAVLMGISVVFGPALILSDGGLMEESWFGGGLALVVYAAVLLGGAWLMWKKGFHEIDVTWYLCARYRRRAAFERRVVRVLIVAIPTVLIIGLPWVDVQFQILFVAVSVAVAACWKVSCEERLLLREKRGDLFILTGHRKKFFEAATKGANHF